MKKKNMTILVMVTLIVIVAIGLLYTRNPFTTEESLYVRAEISTKDDPFARLEYERRMLIDPATGKIPDNIRSKELQFASSLPKVETLSLNKENLATWTSRGPINRGGRTRALGIDIRTQTAPNITIIAGGVSGGIYKSIDNGATWVNKLPPAVIHSVTCIAQDVSPGFENTWYVGTGEAMGNSASGSFSAFFTGDGVFKSVDNGETWFLLPSTSDGNGQSFDSPWSYVHNVAVNNLTGSVWAAASNVIMKSPAGTGGTAWGLSLSTLANNIMSEVQITSTGFIYAAIPSGVTNAGILRSIDDGNSFTIITPIGFPASYGRVVMAIAPSNENIVYIWVYTGTGVTKTELWQYDASGGTWLNRTANLPAPVDPVEGIDVQGSYDMVLKVKPDDPNFVVIGGTNLYRTTDGFATPVTSSGWIGGYATSNDVTQYSNHHPDQHSLVFLQPPNANVLYSGHDGGISRTNDVTQTPVVWTDLGTGYVTSQFYSLAIDPVIAYDRVIAGGLQDNGNYTTVSDNLNTNWINWNHGGDGGFAEVRKTSSTTYTIYLEGQNGWLWRQQYNTSGTITADDLIQPTIGSPFAFVNPFVLDINNADIMYFAAGVNVLRSTNVSSSADWEMLTNVTTGNDVTALSISKATANRLYVGTNNGEVLKVDGANTGNPTIVNISAGLPIGAYVSCIYVHPLVDNIIVVLSNYSVKSLWSSNNGEASWTDISGNLEQNPDGSGNGPSCRWVTSVFVFANAKWTYFVATSTGLYSTNDLNGAASVWTQEGSNSIGNVVCTMVKARDSDGLVAVATHGAGIYSTSLISSVEDGYSLPKDYTLSQNYPNPFNPRTTISFSLPQAGQVKLSLFDALGKEIDVIADKHFSAGYHSLNYNATVLPSGVYFYRIETGSFIQSKKMILIK